MALLSSPHQSPRGPEAAGKFGVRVSRRLPAPPPSDAALAPVPALLGCQSACASLASVPQGHSLLQPSVAPGIHAAVGGLHAHGPRRRASSQGMEATRIIRPSLGSEPQCITDTTSPTTCVVAPAMWFPRITALVFCDDLWLHVNQDFRRDGGSRAGRLERVLGTTAALDSNDLYCCPTTASNLLAPKDSTGARV
ncbi:uncharacterized protein LOC144166909 [Haemaphysalis longicornis]